MPTIATKDGPALDQTTSEIYGDIMRTYGLPEPRSIYRLMGHTPQHLASSWPRSRFLYGSNSSLTIRDKHVLTFAISSVHGCEYCCRSHSTRLRQLGLEDGGLLDVLSAVAATAGACRLAAGQPSLDGSQTTLLFLPTISSRIPQPLNLQIGFVVAAAEGSPSGANYYAARLKSLRIGDDGIAELLFLVDLVTGYNRYVQGLQVDPWEGVRQPWGEEAEANRAKHKPAAGSSRRVSDTPGERSVEKDDRTKPFMTQGRNVR